MWRPIGITYGGVDVTADQPGAIRGTSRRTFLRNAVLVGAGATAVGCTSISRAATTQASSAAGAPSPDATAELAAAAVSRKKIEYGAMHGVYEAWVKNAGDPHGKYSERRYFDAFNSIPKNFADAMCFSNHVTMSIRPLPDELFNPGRHVPDNGSGHTTLDDQIKHLLSTCPNGVELTCWHEAQSDN